MFRSFFTGMAGMCNHRLRMDVISNNISNLNTSGYKASQASFQDTLYQVLRSAGGQSVSSRVGTGVTLAAVTTDFRQGPLQATGRVLDLAINGNGFFGVKESSDSDKLYFTRDGSFFINKEGYLVNANGMYVVGKDEKPIKIEISDKVAINTLSVSRNGEISGELTNGSKFGENGSLVLGLFNFPNPSGLTRVGNNLLLESPASGARIAGSPGKDGLGMIESGFLEMSNIDLVFELGNLIMTQRGYEANAKVFLTSDEVLKETIDLKR